MVCSELLEVSKFSKTRTFGGVFSGGDPKVVRKGQGTVPYTSRYDALVPWYSQSLQRIESGLDCTLQNAIRCIFNLHEQVCESKQPPNFWMGVTRTQGRDKQQRALCPVQSRMGCSHHVKTVEQTTEHCKVYSRLL